MVRLTSVIALCALIAVQVGSQDIFSTNVQWCNNINKDVIDLYRSALYEFATVSYRAIGNKALGHLVFSPLSSWLILAAIAEGAHPTTRQIMFKFLQLPADPCIRLKFYQLAMSRYSSSSSNDVKVLNTRAFIIDESVTINPIYHNFLYQNNLLSVISAPIHNEPHVALQEIRRITSAQLQSLDLSGNSVILDAVDFKGLWSTAFEDALIEKAPFFSQNGEQIGFVDLMKVRRRARMTYVESINAKVLELPIGKNGRYRMIFAIILGNDFSRAVRYASREVIDDILNDLKESYVPIDIAIPRISLTSEFNVKKALEELGLQNLWTDPSVTQYMSKPAALPSGYVQRSTLSLDKHGVRPAPNTKEPSNNASTGLDPILGRDFTANKPFLMGLFDAETYSCIMAAVSSQPTYTNCY